jgi:hypothetical protein
MGDLFGGDDGYWEICWRIIIWLLNITLLYKNE